MVEDKEGQFASWKEGDKIEHALMTKEIILTTDPKDYDNSTNYKIVESEVPKQAAD